MAVAQHLSFTRAGDALGVTASAASLQIRSLEQYLSRTLFRRDGRQVVLTEQGAALLPRVRQALEQLEWAVDDLRQESEGGPLRISTLASFLQQWLLPRLPLFRAMHPHIDLHLQSSDELVDFVRGDCHLAIRFGHGRWPGVSTEKLLDDWLVPVCAPALLAKHGPLREAGDLRRYPLLHSVSEPWSTWLLNGEAPEVRSSLRGSLVDDSQINVRMAVQGAGLALARWSLVSSEVADGTLVRASPVSLPYERSYWMVSPTRALELRHVAQFAAWLRLEASRFRPPPAN